MTVDAIPGRLSKLYVSTDGGVTYFPVGGIVDITPDKNLDALETSNHDSEGHRSYIPNFDDMTLGGSCLYIDGDPGQDALIDSQDNKVPIPFRYYPQIQPGKRVFEGELFPTNLTPGAAPLDEVQTMNLDLRCSGVFINRQT